MIHCYAPEVLGELLKFKVSDELVPGKALLALLLDGQRNYDQEIVERILFEGKKTSTNRGKRLEVVKQTVKELFTWKYHGFEKKNIGTKEDAGEGTWLLEIKSCEGMDASVIDCIKKRRKRTIRKIRKKYRALQKGVSISSCTTLHSNSKYISSDNQCKISDKHDVHSTRLPALDAASDASNEKQAFCYEEAGTQQGSRKKSHEAKTRNATMLKFLTQVQKKERQYQTNDRFLPVFSPEAFKPQVTVRKREDLVNPRRVTYIKFFERIKPSTYAMKKDKLFVRNSLRKIPNVLDYEYDSDIEWENCDDAEDMESTSDSEDADEEADEGDDIDFVDTESETSLDRKFRPLEISFPELNVTIFYDYKSNLNAPLLRYEIVPDFLLHKLENGVKECCDIKAFSAAFASKHNIKLRAVKKKVQEMFPTIAS
eukprot:jgi/Antlo1/919/2435